MLLIDGVKYELWTPTDEDELEKMVQEHAKDIFGPDSLYFDLKHKLKGSSVAAIPDGFAITFSPDQWWIVEVELSSHPVYDHIQNQVGKFIASLTNSATRSALVNSLWNEINADDIVKAGLQKTKGGEVFKWLSELINQQPQIGIIIDDKNTPGLSDAIAALRIQPVVCDFTTYAREGVGIDVHAHIFEPMYLRTAMPPSERIIPKSKKEPVSLPRKAAKRVQIQDLLGAGLLKVDQSIFRTYKGIRYEAKILDTGKIRVTRDGSIHDSLSGAAKHITNSAINGWIFWETFSNTGQVIPLDTLWNEYLRPK